VGFVRVSFSRARSTGIADARDPRTASRTLTPVTNVLLVSRGEGRRGRDRAEFGPCFRDDDATSVMTHVDVGIVTIISHWWRRDIVVVVCVIIHTPGVIIHTRVHDHVTSHNS